MWYDPCDPYFYDVPEQEEREAAPVRSTLEEFHAALADAEAALLTATGSRIDMWREEVRNLRRLIANRSARMAA